MSNKKISELPIYNPESMPIMDMVITNDGRHLHRVIVQDYIINTEDEAIKIIKQHFANGKNVLILSIPAS